MKIIHHGAVNGVTGSCHELCIDNKSSILVDCGLFQGDEKPVGRSAEIDFSTSKVKALVVTHCHLDHVGRIPYLLAAGFNGPIYTSEASSLLLPIVLEDALKLGFTRNTRLIRKFLAKLDSLVKPLEYKKWQQVSLASGGNLKIKLQPAGHILGSAYVECDVSNGSGSTRVIFSGDLGASYTPLLPTPKSPYRADILVIESTYGDHLHKRRKHRVKQLENILVNCARDGGTVLIPAFSIGRTQELLYEIEQIIWQQRDNNGRDIDWTNIDIILDSPLAGKYTQGYQQLKSHWDNEARRKTSQGRHPLSFEQLYVVEDHKTHKQTVSYLKKSGRFAVVIAASGMCSGGRILNYLKSLLPDGRTDVLFVGYQARGTLGRKLQSINKAEWVTIDREAVQVNANLHTLSGYSAHADQKGLLTFIKGIRQKPAQIRIVHGDEEAKQELREKVLAQQPGVEVVIP